MNTLKPVPTCLVAVLLSICLPSAAQSVYSPGGWPTLHHDSGNRRAVDIAIMGREYSTWQTLADATVLTAPTTSPDGQHIYATTGLAEGRSNLHAYSIQGELLWRSAPWTTADDSVDPCALLSSPIVDVEGDIYVGDCNQLFAFRPSGEIKWVIELPPVQAGDWRPVDDHPVNALTTAAFTADGNILGVTNFGDIIIVDRDSGAVINSPYRLPGLIPPYSTVVPMPDSMLANGMMDPRFKEWTWQLIFGGMMRSANTPAVSAAGRLFVVGSGDSEGLGALYGLELVRDEQQVVIEQAFMTEIGLGSGSSPALSPGEDQVYVSDEEGWLYGLNASTGEILWKVLTKAAAGAAGVDKDGTVYALQANAPAVVAVSPQGTILWQSDLNEQEQQLSSHWLLGDPVSVGNGNPTITGDAILVPVTYGYHLSVFGVKLPLPVRSAVVAIDKSTGLGRSDLVSLPTDSSGITAILSDGTVVSSLGGVLTSSISQLQTLANFLLPEDLTLLQAQGGIQVAIPDQ